MTAPQTTPRLFPSWVETGTVTALLVPLFYTAGWSYAYHYFEKFNLGLMGLEIPKEYFFLYSYWTGKDQFLAVLLVLAAYLGAYVLTRSGYQKLETGITSPKAALLVRTISAFLVPVMIFSLFWIFYLLGERAAGNAYDWQLAHDFRSYQRVQIWAKVPGVAPGGKPIVAEWEKGCYRLLMRNKDHLFLFYTVHPVRPGDKMPSDIVPSGRIEMVRILTDNESCKGNAP